MRESMILLALASAGCATMPPHAGAPAPGDVPVHGAVPGRACNSDRLAGFAGRAATAQLGAEILAASGAARLRWVPQGTIITMEYDESRVTVRLDPFNRIESARCG